ALGVFLFNFVSIAQPHLSEISTDTKRRKIYVRKNFSIYMQNVLVRLVQLPQNVKAIVLFIHFLKK
ncbi:hypothetical protein CWN03_13175, partial [Klebsiella quasipneumoniae]